MTIANDRLNPHPDLYQHRKRYVVKNRRHPSLERVINAFKSTRQVPAWQPQPKDTSFLRKIHVFWRYVRMKYPRCDV